MDRSGLTERLYMGTASFRGLRWTNRARRQFGEFVADRSSALIRVAYLLCGDQDAAEDLLQSALTKTAARWRNLRHCDPEGYIRTVMYREQVSRWRRAARQQELLVDSPLEAAADQSRHVDLRLAMRAHLLRLPPAQRAVLVLRFFEDLTESQAAEVLGCSVGTVVDGGAAMSDDAIYDLVRSGLADLAAEARPVDLFPETMRRMRRRTLSVSIGAVGGVAALLFAVAAAGAGGGEPHSTPTGRPSLSAAGSAPSPTPAPTGHPAGPALDGPARLPSPSLPNESLSSRPR